MYNCKFNDIGCFCINLYIVNFIKFVKNCKKKYVYIYMQGESILSIFYELKISYFVLKFIIMKYDRLFILDKNII